MNKEQILRELESLYKGFRDIGNHEKASEVMTQIIALQTANEAVPETEQKILLG